MKSEIIPSIRVFKKEKRISRDKKAKLGAEIFTTLQKDMFHNTILVHIVK